MAALTLIGVVAFAEAASAFSSFSGVIPTPETVTAINAAVSTQLTIIFFPFEILDFSIGTSLISFAICRIFL